MAELLDRPLIFISHAGEDTWIARQLAAKVDDAGGRTFLDEAQIPFSDNPETADARIARALAEAAELVVLLTPWAIERPRVWVEISLAYWRSPTPCPIYVVLLGLSRRDFLAMEKIPDFLKTQRIMRLNDVDCYLDDLKVRLFGASDEKSV